MVWFKLVNSFGKQHDKASQQSLNESTQQFHFGILAKENNTKSRSVKCKDVPHFIICNGKNWKKPNW